MRSGWLHSSVDTPAGVWTRTRAVRRGAGSFQGGFPAGAGDLSIQRVGGFWNKLPPVPPSNRARDQASSIRP